MTSNELFMNSHAVRVRELKEELSRTKEELLHVRNELESLQSHFSLAVMAAVDFERLPANGKVAIIDGWNAVLGSASILTMAEKRFPPQTKRECLFRVVRNWLEANPDFFAWIVFDGSRPDSFVDERMRVSFTGGEGRHRADKMICDYLRMRNLSGKSRAAVVFTEDNDFSKEVKSLGGEVRAVADLLAVPANQENLKQE